MPARILAVHQQLIALRRRHPWLHTAQTDVVHVANTAVSLRTATGTDAIVTVLNLADEPASLPAANATAVLAGSATVTDGRAELAPHGWAVLGG